MATRFVMSSLLCSTVKNGFTNCTEHGDDRARKPTDMDINDRREHFSPLSIPGRCFLWTCSAPSAVRIIYTNWGSCVRTPKLRGSHSPEWYEPGHPFQHGPTTLLPTLCPHGDAFTHHDYNTHLRCGSLKILGAR